MVEVLDDAERGEGSGLTSERPGVNGLFELANMRISKFKDKKG